jgi:nitrate/nitrite-specific signal transduction histidine kinase
MIFKKLIQYSLLSSLLSTTTFALAINSSHQAIDIAGKQRMFTQRMLKDYSMIGMKNSFGNPSKDLKKIINDFEENLKLLKAYTKKSEIKAKISKEMELWRPIKKRLQAKANREKIIQFQEQIDQLLASSNEITNLFVSESGKEQGEIVNLSGRERMLSQRMASLYMLKVWGVEDSAFQEKMKKSMDEFKTALLKLESYPLNSDEINRYLKRVKHSFMFFEIMSRSSTKFIPTLIYQKSNEILKDMDIVTKKYVLIESKK